MPERAAVDMSPEAIDLRLREISQLRKLALSLQGLRDLGRAEDLGPERFKRRPADAVEPPESQERRPSG